MIIKNLSASTIIKFFDPFIQDKEKESEFLCNAKLNGLTYEAFVNTVVEVYEVFPDGTKRLFGIEGYLNDTELNNLLSLGYCEEFGSHDFL